MEIIHFTPGRSGSTFISQILRSLFGEENVIATHNPITLADQKLIITVRDFRDVLVSWWRTHENISPAQIERGMKLSPQHVDTYSKIVKGQVEKLNQMASDSPTAIIMKYHLFYPDNFEYVFQQLESLIIITPEKKDIIRQEYSLARNIQRQSKYSHFGQHANNQGIHGNHIYQGKIGGWRDLISDSDLSRINLDDELKQWGYL